MDFVVGGWLVMIKDEVGETRMLILGHDDAWRIWNPLSLTNLSPSIVMKKRKICRRGLFGRPVILLSIRASGDISWHLTVTEGCYSDP